MSSMWSRCRCVIMTSSNWVMPPPLTGYVLAKLLDWPLSEDPRDYIFRRDLLRDTVQGPVESGRVGVGSASSVEGVERSRRLRCTTPDCRISPSVPSVGLA